MLTAEEPMPRILVVDDDAAIRTAVADVLELEGHAVGTVAHGVAGPNDAAL